MLEENSPLLIEDNFEKTFSVRMHEKQKSCLMTSD